MCCFAALPPRLSLCSSLTRPPLLLRQTTPARTVYIGIMDVNKFRIALIDRQPELGACLRR